MGEQLPEYGGCFFIKIDVTIDIIMKRVHPDMSLIRLNMDEAVVPESFGDRAIGIDEDMEKSIRDLWREVKSSVG